MEIWYLFEYIYLVLVFVIFRYFFYFVKFLYDEMLASRLWKSLLFLTHSSWAFSCMRFAVIWISFQFTFIEFYYWSLFWNSLLYCLAFCGNQLFEFYRNSTDWLPHDAGSGCGESRNRLITVLYSFLFLFTCPLLSYSSFAGIFWVRARQTF